MSMVCVYSYVYAYVHVFCMCYNCIFYGIYIADVLFVCGLIVFSCICFVCIICF